MTSGQWDLNALEALEREALEVFDVLDVPEHIRRTTPIQTTPLTTTLPTATTTNTMHHTPHPNHHFHHHLHQHRSHAIVGATADMMDMELEDHIKHCSCTCNHMGYGNFMDYQTSCFGGLPDVTEHSNNRHSIVRREPSSNSESLDISCTTHQKPPLPSSRDTSPTPTIINSSTYKEQPPPKEQQLPHQKIHRKSKKCCICSCLTIFFLTSCALIGILVIKFIFEENYSGDRESDVQRMKIIRRLLHETPLIDGHNDLPYNIRSYAHNRLGDLNFVDGLNKTEPWKSSVWSQTDLPRLRQGLIGAQFWSAYVPCKAQGLDAVQLALEQIDLIQRFTEAYRKHMVLVMSSQDIIATHRNGLIASLVGVEGGHALGSSLSVLRSMYSLGARYLTLTHTCDNQWAGSAESPSTGLSPFGRAVIKEMNRLGMMIDLSHTSDATAKDVLKETRAPIIFSHSAARALCNSTRNIADDILREVADNGGIVMVSFYSLHLTCDKEAKLVDVIAHINYIRAIAGIQHIGIGAGYDGIDAPPAGLEDVSKYPHLFAELLKDPNWTEEDLTLLSGKNILRVFKSVENVRDYLKRISPLETITPSKHSQCTSMPS